MFGILPILFRKVEKKSYTKFKIRIVRHYGIPIFRKYTPQNNLRTTSFISPLVIPEMRPSSFTNISWKKLEVSALFQSAQHVRSMFSYKTVNATNNTRPKDSKKNGYFQKKQFLPQNEGFSQYRKNSLFNENNTLSNTKSSKLNLHSSKRHTDMARKRDQPFERLKMPRKFPIDNE